MTIRKQPILVAIVGGSGSGKTWLARKLERAFAPDAVRISLDDFYRDRSQVAAWRRSRINFDHPRAIDWAGFERVLRDCRAGRATQLPCYDFATHCRLNQPKLIQPHPIILVDGLWLLRRPSIRRLFDLRVFIECPGRTRLKRRLKRDVRSRARTQASVRKQFRETVEPMHQRFVAPQRRWANVVLVHPERGSANRSSFAIQKVVELVRARSVPHVAAAHRAALEIFGARKPLTMWSEG